MQRKGRQALGRSRAAGSATRHPLVSLNVDADRIELAPIERDEDDYHTCEDGRSCEACRSVIRAEALLWLRDLNSSLDDASDPSYTPWESHLPGDLT